MTLSAQRRQPLNLQCWGWQNSNRTSQNTSVCPRKSSDGCYWETWHTQIPEHVVTVELGTANANKGSGEVKELKEKVFWVSTYYILSPSAKVFLTRWSPVIYPQTTTKGYTIHSSEGHN